jgi:hypothetical protein
MIDWVSVGAIVLAFVGGVVSDRWIWLGRQWASWSVERHGKHLQVEPHKSIVRAGLMEEIVLRLRIKNKASRTIPVQVSYGDDPAFLSTHPECVPWRAVLQTATFMVNGNPSLNGGRELPAGDAIEIEMRLKPVAPGRTGLVVSAIARGFEAQWSNSPPFLIEVVSDSFARCLPEAGHTALCNKPLCS